MSNNIKGNSSPRTYYWLIRGVLLESLRRREVAVVFLFMALFIVGAIVARFVGAETDAAAFFILNLGMSLAWFLAIILSILMAGRQFPDEHEKRTIYPLLAKPVGRLQYVVGKWLACWLCGSLVALILSGLALVASPWPKSLSVVLLAQAVILEIMAVGVASALALTLSLKLPKAMAYVITAFIAFAGSQFVMLIQNLSTGSSASSAVHWIMGYVPNFSRFDLMNMFSLGMPPIGILDFVLRIIYSLTVAAFALAIGAIIFERKPL